MVKIYAIDKKILFFIFSAALALPPLGKIPSLVKEESRVRSRRDQTFDEVKKLEYLNICVWPKFDCLVDSRLDLRPLDGRRLPWWQQRFHTSQVFFSFAKHLTKHLNSFNCSIALFFHLSYSEHCPFVYFGICSLIARALKDLGARQLPFCPDDH